MMRHLAWASVTILVGLITFMFGVMIGMAFNEINTEIDLCSDTSSGRYISDPETRKRICD